MKNQLQITNMSQTEWSHMTKIVVLTLFMTVYKIFSLHIIKYIHVIDCTKC